MNADSLLCIIDLGCTSSSFFSSSISAKLSTITFFGSPSSSSTRRRCPLVFATSLSSTSSTSAMSSGSSLRWLLSSKRGVLVLNSFLSRMSLHFSLRILTSSSSRAASSSTLDSASSEMHRLSSWIDRELTNELLPVENSLKSLNILILGNLLTGWFQLGSSSSSSMQQRSMQESARERWGRERLPRCSTKCLGNLVSVKRGRASADSMEVELSRELLRSAVEKWPTFSALFLRRIMIINRAQRPRAGFQIVVVMILKDCRVEQRQEGKPARTFLVGKPLGSGSFATVYEANEGGKGSATQIALKVVSKEALTPDLQRKLARQIDIQGSLQHPHIVRLKGAFQDEKYHFLIMQLCTHQSLSELLKRRRFLSEPEGRYYLRQLAKALSYLHEQHVVHRDVKLANLFIAEGLVLKLGDFGFASKVEPNSKRYSICGTPNFMAPEIVSRSEEGHAFPSDVWSFGALAYTLLIGVPPFQHVDLQTTYKRIKAGTFDFPKKRPVSPVVADLIRWTLQLQPGNRPTAAQLQTHPFFTDCQIPGSLPLTTLVSHPQPQFIEQYSSKDSIFKPRFGEQLGKQSAVAEGKEDSIDVDGSMRSSTDTYRSRRDTNHSVLKKMDTTPVKEEPVPSLFQDALARQNSKQGESWKADEPLRLESNLPLSYSHQESESSPPSPDLDLRLNLETKQNPSLQICPQVIDKCDDCDLDRCQPAQTHINFVAQAERQTQKQVQFNNSQQEQQKLNQKDLAQQNCKAQEEGPKQNLSRGDIAGPTVTGPTLQQEGWQVEIGKQIDKPVADVDEMPCHQNRGDSQQQQGGESPGILEGKCSFSQPHQFATEQSEEKDKAAISCQKPVQSQQANFNPYEPVVPPSDTAETSLQSCEAASRLKEGLPEPEALKNVGNTVGQGRRQVLASEECRKESEARVQKYIEMKKYGLGYLLTNGVAGALFNDFSKMVAYANQGILQYYDSSNTLLSQFQEDEPPATLLKKTVLLKRFAKELGENWLKRDRPTGVGGSPFVRKWLHSPEATIFKLSDGRMQVAFKDGVELVISPVRKQIRYIREGEESTHRISDTRGFQPQLRRRVRQLKVLIKDTQETETNR